MRSSLPYSTGSMRLCQSLLLIFSALLNAMCSDYFETRNKIIEAERRTAIGGDIVLTDKEKTANQILLAFKSAEFGEPKFLASQNFLGTKNEIEKSSVFSIIAKLPKWGSLHTHLTASVSVDHLLEIIFKYENIYGCIQNDRLKLKVFDFGNVSTTCEWKLLRDMRKNSTWSDEWIKSQLRITNRGNPPNVSADDVWQQFRGIFTTIIDMLSYKPIFKDYLFQSLSELYLDNVFYSEYRTNFFNLYDLDGTTHDFKDFLETFRQAVEDFKIDHPNFVGAKIIYSIYRKSLPDQLEEALKTYAELKELFPDVLIGFDLLGSENDGNNLIDYHRQFENAKNVTDFFFHAGETNWFGTDVDYNLLDAVLLKTKRIGHGFALPKHPKLLEMVKENDIAIEICPISNQVLMLVEDLRNHPASFLVANGFPVVICNDDPGIWGATGLSFDWYVFFMAISRQDSGLEVLKQLAINSITYSGLTPAEKSQSLSDWNKQWDLFVDFLIENYADAGSRYRVTNI